MSDWRIQKELGLQRLENLHWAGPDDLTYVLLMRLLGLVCAVLVYFVPAPTKVEASNEFYRFQASHLTVAFMSQVWNALQWPYFHVYYQSLSFAKHDICFIIAAYFVATAVASPLAGAAADKWGHSRVSYLFGCFTATSFFMELSGGLLAQTASRVAGGAATAFLITSFESRLVSEHLRRGFRPDLLSATFCTIGLGTPVVSLIAVAMVNYALQDPTAGIHVPARLAVLLSGLTCLFIWLMWREDRESTPSTSKAVLSIVFDSACTILRSKRLLTLLLLETACGAPILLLPLLWAPTVIDDGRTMSLGLIYANLAISSMIGSTLAPLLLHPPTSPALHQQLSKLLPLLVPAAITLIALSRTQEVVWQFTSLCVFYLCAGAISPILAHLRSSHAPDQKIGSVYGILKCPAHIIVAIFILRGESASTIWACTMSLVLAMLVCVVSLFIKQ